MAGTAARIFARLNDGRETERTTVQFGTAFVLGGSIAGLLAARVLANHAERVVIVERDAAAGAEPRPGVPQGFQIHALLPAGLAQLERWFPGFTEQAVAEGAVLSGPVQTMNYYDDARQVRVGEAEVLTCSRPYTESLIRRRTLALPNVEMINGRVTGLVFADGAVTAVRYIADDVANETSVDFVVDAMGRASKLSDWLEQDGWQRPELERRRTDINYVTCWFKRADERPAIGTAVARYSIPQDGLSGAALSAIEDGQWMVMMGGYGADRPGRTMEDFLARCDRLPQVFRKAVEGEPVGEIKSYHQADSRRRHFARLQRLPARLVSVGDAVASFNPIYGQGMASATLHASALSEYLRSAPDHTAPARHFFALQQVVVDAAWETSADADLPDDASLMERLRKWIRDQLLAAAIVDRTVAERFNAVIYMIEHPSVLATLGTVSRAVIANLRSRR